MRAKWVLLADGIRGQVRSGRLQVGDRLPSTSQLCAQLGVSSIVVRNAMIQLKAEGLVVGKPGVGVFITRDVRDE